MTLNIGVLTRLVSPFGGIEKYNYELIRALLSLKKCKIHIISENRDSGFINGNVKLVHVPVFTRKIAFIENLSYCILSSMKIKGVEREVDLFHGHGIYGFGYTLSKAKKPLVLTLHGTQREELRAIEPLNPYDYQDKKIFFPFYASLEEETVRKAKFVLANSKHTAVRAETDYDIPKSKVKIVYGGVDTERYRPSIRGGEVREKLKLKGKVIIFVGRLVSRKRLDDLLIAFRLVKKRLRGEASLIIIGEGPYRKHLEKFSKALKIDRDVVFTGKVSEEEIPLYYAASDLFVLPSRYEGLGLVVLEAFASGKPVVATKVGGCVELVENGVNGFIVPPRQPIIMAEKILNILSNDELRREMGVKARMKAEEFSWSKIAEKHLKIYMEATEP